MENSDLYAEIYKVLDIPAPIYSDTNLGILVANDMREKFWQFHCTIENEEHGFTCTFVDGRARGQGTNKDLGRAIFIAAYHALNYEALKKFNDGKVKELFPSEKKKKEKYILATRCKLVKYTHPDYDDEYLYVVMSKKMSPNAAREDLGNKDHGGYEWEVYQKLVNEGQGVVVSENDVPEDHFNQIPYWTSDIEEMHDFQLTIYEFFHATIEN